MDWGIVSRNTYGSGSIEHIEIRRKSLSWNIIQKARRILIRHITVNRGILRRNITVNRGILSRYITVNQGILSRCSIQKARGILSRYITVNRGFLSRYIEGSEDDEQIDIYKNRRILSQKDRQILIRHITVNRRIISRYHKRTCEMVHRRILSKYHKRICENGTDIRKCLKDPAKGKETGYGTICGIISTQISVYQKKIDSKKGSVRGICAIQT